MLGRSTREAIYLLWGMRKCTGAGSGTVTSLCQKMDSATILAPSISFN